MENAQSETPGTWRGEGRGDQRSDYSDSQERVGSDGGQPGGVSVGDVRAAWQGASLAGGILARLIEDAELRLDEARECIEWYQREESKQLARLKDLEGLKALEEHREGPPLA